MKNQRQVEIAVHGKQIPVLNYAKGFSILTVVLMHLVYSMKGMPSVFRTMSSIGGTGVHVFFLCSGIGLYWSYLHRPMQMGEFLRKRLVKIYLPYILVVFISVFFPFMYGKSDWLLALLSHVFLFKMIVPTYQVSFGIQFWFVSTIIQLYLLFIPMVYVKKRLNNNAFFLALFGLLSLLWWIGCYVFQVSDIRVFNSFAFQFIWEFALGFVLADYLKKRPFVHLPYIWLILAAVVGIGIQAVLALSSTGLKLFNDVPALIGYASLVLLLGEIPLIRRACVGLSNFSYELFLLHMLVINTLFYCFSPATLFGQLIVAGFAFVLSLGVAYGYHLLVFKLFNDVITSYRLPNRKATIE